MLGCFQSRIGSKMDYPIFNCKLTNAGLFYTLMGQTKSSVPKPYKPKMFFIILSCFIVFLVIMANCSLNDSNWNAQSQTLQIETIC